VEPFARHLAFGGEEARARAEQGDVRFEPPLDVGGRAPDGGLEAQAVLRLGVRGDVVGGDRRQEQRARQHEVGEPHARRLPLGAGGLRAGCHL
jgi:hypothetical protein